jgi:hypothetical protein
MTSFQKIKLSGYDNKPVPFKSTVDYPQPPPESLLPNNFFTALVIGSTGTGKSFSVAKLLKYQEQHKFYNKDDEEVPQRIFLCSPSIPSNEIFNSLKYLDEEDMVHEFTDAKLQIILDDIKETKREAEQYQEELKEYRKFMKSKRVNDLSPKTLLTLHKIDFEPPVAPKYKIPPVNSIIFDDLLNSPAYKATGKSLINSLCVRNRHLGINVYILGQTSSQIPKCIRSQARLLMLYRYNSKTIIDDLYEIVSSILTPEEFEQIYMTSTEEKYNFLTVDNTKKDLVLKQNLDHLIVLNRKEKINNLLNAPKKTKKKKDIEIKEDV